MAKAPTKKATSAKKGQEKQPSSVTGDKTRSYMSQEDVPGYELEEALLVAKALVQEYGGHPAAPLDVAAAMDLTPTSGKFRMLCGASIAYGLTMGVTTRRRSLLPTSRSKSSNHRRRVRIWRVSAKQS